MNSLGDFNATDSQHFNVVNKCVDFNVNNSLETTQNNTLLE